MAGQTKIKKNMEYTGNPIPSLTERYLVNFINQMCLIGHEPVSGHPYRTDAQCLSLAFNQYLQQVGSDKIPSRRFNTLVVRHFGVQKIELGGRNVFLGLGRKDEPYTYVARQNNVGVSDTERRETKKVYNRNYYLQHKESKRTAIEAMTTPKENVENTDQTQNIMCDTTLIEDVLWVSTKPADDPPMVPLDKIGDGLTRGANWEKLKGWIEPKMVHSPLRIRPSTLTRCNMPGYVSSQSMEKETDVVKLRIVRASNQHIHGL